VQGRRAPVWCVWALIAVVGLVCGLAAPGPASAQSSRLGGFLATLAPADLVPGADAFGSVAGDPPAAEVLRGGERVGVAFLTTDAANSTGYSGKPIDIVVGMTLEGVIAGAVLVEHHEPIVLAGIPEHRVIDFIAGYRDLNVVEVASRPLALAPVDIVSGATVTIMVIDDSIKRAAIRVAHSRGLGGLAPVATAAPGPRRTIDPDMRETADWRSLLGDGSVRRLKLTVGDVNDAFAVTGNQKAIDRPERGEPGDVFIDLYVTLATIPTIGRSLLGEAEYKNMLDRLAPGQQAILVAGNGRYSFRGSGYVRGGIFDRIQLIQGEASVRFRDRGYKRLGDLAPADAPRFKEIGLFLIPEDAGFDPAEPWRLQLLVQRATGALEKVFTTSAVGYIPPDRYILTETPVALPAAVAAPLAGFDDTPLWQRLWQTRVVDIAVLAVALAVLTAIFFFQDWLVRRPRLANRVRTGFLIFTVVWIGYYANAQLSVVNVMTFANAMLTEFRWEFFLTEPLIFLLWLAVPAGLLFWGRGAYCGWLCPFGALQELMNKLAKLARVPQVTVPWGLHERIWPVKYVLFLGLFGLSFHSLALAEQAAEVEPFKTAIVLRFAREWGFVAFAVALLAAGLFIERFYCRYLCVLGAALAIPGRLRMFEWLRRYKECGSPCHRCAGECMVQAIHPDGHINPNECLYCLHCQELYYDDHRCPVVIEKRLRRERRLGKQSQSMASGD